MNPKLFRQAALERLSSPERLDSLMEVVNLKVWIVLAGCFAALLAVLAWGVLGRVADEVEGMGILVREGGLYTVDTVGSGPLGAVLVRVGEPVAAGQVVATLACPELEGRIREAEAEREALDGQRSRFLPLLAEEDRSHTESLREQRATLLVSAEAARKRITFLEQRAEAYRTALDKGLITIDRLQEVIQQLASARRELAETRARSHDLAREEADKKAQLSERTFALEREIAALDARLRQLRTRLLLESRVVSPVDGRILEVLRDSGQYLPAGTPVLRLEAASGPLVGYLLVHTEGKRLLPGMEVRMEPSGIRPEEYGRMLGAIRSVSQSPQSLEAMVALLHNRLLAEQLGQGGDAYLVEVVPGLDPGSPSGFRWTTRKGPPVAFGSGTLLSAQVRVRVRPPVALLVPALRRWLRGGAGG
ncbi:MAG: NHLP bacteriocin system secretion protein [Holophaga sp.]